MKPKKFQFETPGKTSDDEDDEDDDEDDDDEDDEDGLGTFLARFQ